MITLTATITLADGTEIAIDKRNMLTIEQNIIDRDNINLPSFGIISNGGSIEFSDYDGRLLNYAESGALNEGLKCAIFINNTIRKIKHQVALFETSQWNYDNNNRVVSVSLKDDLEEWQNIYVDGFSYDARNPTAQNLRDFYDYLYEKTPTKYNMLSFNSLGTTTQNHLSNIYIKYPMLKSGNLWHQWNKLCAVAQSHIYKTALGTTLLAYNGGD